MFKRGVIPNLRLTVIIYWGNEAKIIYLNLKKSRLIQNWYELSCIDNIGIDSIGIYTQT